MTSRARLAIAVASAVVGGLAASPAATAGRTLTCAEVSVHVPAGWRGRVVPGGDGGFLLVVSTGPLAAVGGDVLGGTLSRLHRGGIVVALLGYGVVDPAATTFPRLRAPLTTRSMPLHAMFEGMPAGDRVARRWFRSHGSGYDVQVYFGADHVTPALRARADAVLAGLSFARAPRVPTAAGGRTRCRS